MKVEDVSHNAKYAIFQLPRFVNKARQGIFPS